MITNEELTEFCEAVRAKCEADQAKNFPSLAANPLFAHVITFERGPKYTRIVRDFANGGSRSVFCFVDNEGNILKADGWKRPAKHVRGHIKNGADDVGPYGPAYLK